MKVLSISTDRKVFEEGSAVRGRLLQYGRLVDEIHVVVFAKRSLGFSDETFPPNIFLYPTNSSVKFFHIFFAIARALKMKRRGVSIDVVTTQDPFETGLAGYIVARIFNARLHIQIHTDVMSPYFARESVLNRIRVRIAKFLIPHAQAIRVVSERIKNSIEKIVRAGTSIAVLPILIERKSLQHAVDLKKKYPQFDSHILVASRLSREKNIESTIEAMRSVASKYPKAGLIIVGSGLEEKKLKKRVAQLALGENVIFEGWQDDLSGYYKTADIFVLPSFYEGYGMTVIEALTEKCPVIMTDVGCAGDIVKDGQNGLVVPVGDTMALTQAICDLISGKVKLVAIPPELPTEEEYLSAYKRSWESALL